jgi:hypothetical protein
MSIYRGSRGNVDSSWIAGERRFIADRGGMSIPREPRRNVDSPRITGECRFNVWRPAGGIHSLCVCGKRSGGTRATHTLASRAARKGLPFRPQMASGGARCWEDIRGLPFRPQMGSEPCSNERNYRLSNFMYNSIEASMPTPIWGRTGP